MGSARRAWEFQPGRRAGVLGGVRGMLTDTALTDLIFMFSLLCGCESATGLLAQGSISHGGLYRMDRMDRVLIALTLALSQGERGLKCWAVVCFCGYE